MKVFGFVSWVYSGLVLVAGFSAGKGMLGQEASAPAVLTAKSTSLTCKVDHAPASEGDKALSRREYAAALGLYRGMEAASPDLSKAGVVRTLLAQGKVKDAEGLATKWTDAEPQSAVAMETRGEVLFREGMLPEALKTVLDAEKLSACSGRLYLMVGRVQGLSGNHATAARQYKLAHMLAHMLAPNDLEIADAWAGTQPRSKRLERAAALAKDESLLNANDRKSLADSLDHSKDYNKDDCKPVQPAESAEMHMEEILEDSNHRSSFGLYVKLNDKQRTLEIDSGASGILLSKAAAARLGVTHDEKTVVGGIGDEGGIQSAVAHVPSIQIGNMEFRNCSVTILEKRDRMGVDGLIGTDFFEKYLVTLDFPDRKLKLSPLPKRPGDETDESTKEDDNAAPVFHDRYVAPEMKDWTPVWREGHLLLVPVSIGAAKDKLFIVDTGAGLMSISPDAAREVTKVHGDFDMGVIGLSGEVAHVYQTQQFLVTFAHVRLNVGSMTAMDTKAISDDEGFEVSGFMGAPVLNRLTLQIDYRDNLTNFNYDARKDPALLAPTPFY